MIDILGMLVMQGDYAYCKGKLYFKENRESIYNKERLKE